MLARVSHIEAFRRWREDDASTVDDLIRYITEDKPSEAMLAGTAFHKALELAQDGEYETLKANGYTFLFDANAILSLPVIRELRAYGKYGDLCVTGQVDGLNGKTVVDHKTTSRFDAERYLAGCQWRFYLDIFEADTFVWNVFEIREFYPKAYRVSEPHTLSAHRYPELQEDCQRLAGEYLDFARRHLPDYAENTMLRNMMAG